MLEDLDEKFRSYYHFLLYLLPIECKIRYKWKNAKTREYYNSTHIIIRGKNDSVLLALQFVTVATCICVNKHFFFCFIVIESEHHNHISKFMYQVTWFITIIDFKLSQQIFFFSFIHSLCECVYIYIYAKASTHSRRFLSECFFFFHFSYLCCCYSRRPSAELIVQVVLSKTSIYKMFTISNCLVAIY